MKTTLSNIDIRLVKYVVLKRYEHNKRVKAKATYYGKGLENITREKELALGGNSYGGEVAFCRLFNLKPDTSTDEGYPPFDAVLPNGLTVDVKTTSVSNGMLIVKDTGHTADIYALMIGTLPTYTFMGFAARNEIIIPRRWNTGIKKPAWTMKAHELEKNIRRYL